MSQVQEAMRKLIVDVPDHFKPGIVFKDITPLLAHPGLFKSAIIRMGHPFEYEGATHIVGMEARGFMVAAPLATHLNAGFVPARKPGKLPRATIKRKYDLEYGSDGLEIHVGTLDHRSRVVIADDLLATGGTALAVAEMIEQTGAKILGFSFLVVLRDLPGWDKLCGRFGSPNIHTVLTY